MNRYKYLDVFMRDKKVGTLALTYYPSHKFAVKESQIDYNSIAAECMNILKTDYSEDLDTL